MNVIVARSGLAWIVSPPMSTPLPPAPAAQCATALPGKCPPSCSSVTPGTTSRLAVRGDPLPLVGADGAHLDLFGVLHGARAADVHVRPPRSCTIVCTATEQQCARCGQGVTVPAARQRRVTLKDIAQDAGVSVTT